MKKLGVSKMKTVKGRTVGDEAVIGELVRYRRGARFFGSKARIALLEAEECDFDMLFEVSMEFMGFVCIGEYDRNIAEIAEELRLVGLFSEDEKKLTEAINEKTIIFPKRSRAVLTPDIDALKSFESGTLLSYGDKYGENRNKIKNKKIFVKHLTK